MPYLEINTNTTIDNCSEIAEQASKLTADILGKPESYVMVKISPEQTLLFAGSNAPVFVINTIGVNVDTIFFRTLIETFEVKLVILF